MPERGYYEVYQARRELLNAPLCRLLGKTSSPLDLHAFEQVLVVCWRLCAPSFPCHQPSISVPWARRLNKRVFKGTEILFSSSIDFFQPEIMSIGYHHLKIWPSLELHRNVFCNITLPVALFSRQLSQVRLHNWFSKPLQSATWTELELAALNARPFLNMWAYTFRFTSNIKLLPWWTNVLYTMPSSSSITSSIWFSPLSGQCDDFWYCFYASMNLSKLSPVPKRLRTLDWVRGSSSSWP